MQTFLIPLADAVACFGTMIRQFGYKNAARRFWDCLPGWLVLAVLVANALVLIAELSFILIQYHIGDPRPWQEHVPAATALFSSIALAACYVSFRLADA
ncbi:MAG: hypothetical protein ACREQ8_07590 [Woeseiaceae bacterium]